MSTTITYRLGDVRDMLASMPDDSVDLLVTSPPFLALRSYLPADHPDKDREIGSETTPAAFLDTMLGLTADWRRVVTPTGSIAVEIGDTYSGSGGAGGDYGDGGMRAKQPKFRQVGSREHRVERDGTSGDGGDRTVPYNGGAGWPMAKSLCGIPTLYTWSLAYGRNLLTGAESPAGEWRIRNLLTWCLDMDTPVYVRTPTGDRPMRLLHLHQQWQPGRFQLWDGQRWTPVLGTSASSCSDALELRFRNGERISCTTDHQWPVERHGITKMVSAAELTVGDIVPTVNLPDAPPRVTPGLPDDDIGWFVGVFLGDGSFDGKGRIQISGHRALDAERGARLARIAADYDGTCSTYEHGEGMQGNVVVRCKPLAEVVRHYIGGGNARNKHLTPAAWRRSNRFLAALMAGYLESDGHHDKPNDRWKLGFTDNPWLARDLRCVAARLGWSLRLRRFSRGGPDPRGGNWAGTAPHYWSGWLTKDPARRQNPDGEIMAISRSQRRSFVDVGVEGEPHLFALASGLLTHNCRPNPPVGALGDKFRPATSFVTVACIDSKRWFDLDAVRERKERRPSRDGRSAKSGPGELMTGTYDYSTPPNPAGAPPLDWWDANDVDPDDWQPLHRLSTQPYKGSHYAAFPVALPQRLIEAMCPREVCTVCGEPRRRIATSETTKANGTPIAKSNYRGSNVTQRSMSGYEHILTDEATPSFRTIRHTLGWTECGEKCEAYGDGAPWYRPGVVLDPFGGSGTTAVAAANVGRDAVLIDLDERNVDLARQRIAASMRIVHEEHDGDTWTWTVEPASREQIEAETNGQLSFFEEAPV